MKNNNKFDINSFISPDASHAPVYVWVWNDVCTREIIDIQLREMQSLGIRAFYILPEPKNFRPDSMPTSLTPDYLTEEYFELCAYAAEQGKKLGMLCWIYDEGGWPSGGACGRVLKAHPEYARKVLKFHEKTFHAGEVYRKTNADVAAAFLNDKDMIKEGYSFTSDSAVTEYTTEQIINGDADYPDLLNKDATEYFIRITHEKYASSMKNASAVFTDEPKAPGSPFSCELAQRYKELYGESVLPYLPLIAGRAEVTEENIHILHRWYDMLSQVFCDNFLLTCKEWADKHGMAFTGHMDKDHDPLGCMRGGGSFNLMRALRCFDIPGIDVIWRQIYPENKTTVRDDMNAYNGFFPRYASSAAAQNGTKLAMSEIFGVAGPGLTYDIMRYTVGYQAVRGINVFNPFNFPLGRKGAYLAQELPVFTENQVFYRYLELFNRYAERLSYICTVGERVCDTALYYPVHDFQGGLRADAVAKEFDTLGRKLEKMTVDFDIVDDDVLLSADGKENGCFAMGRAVYRHIIIPEGAFVPQDTKKALDKFVKGGGRVSYGCPRISPVIPVDGEGLRAMHRKSENGEIFYLFRESGEKGDYRIYLPSSHGYLLDLEKGTLTHFENENNILSVSLATGETAVILLTEEKLTAESKKAFTDSFDIQGSFIFREDTELVFTENGFESIVHTDTPYPVSLGDWADYVGSDYSGSGIYETRFTLPDDKVGKEGEIDLGKVDFVSSVCINSRHIGTSLMPPHRFRIPAGMLKKENHIKITVTNTSANLYVHTDYFDKWKEEELSPYFDTEKEFAKDLVSGGLYGPVTLYTE